MQEQIKNPKMNTQTAWGLIRENKDEFGSWIRGNGAGKDMDRLEQSYIDTCSEEAEERGLCGGSLFAIRRAHRIREISGTLAEDDAFRKLNASKNGRPLISLDKYARFCDESGEPYGKPEPEEIWAAMPGMTPVDVAEPDVTGFEAEFKDFPADTEEAPAAENPEQTEEASGTEIPEKSVEEEYDPLSFFLKELEAEVSGEELPEEEPEEESEEILAEEPEEISEEEPEEIPEEEPEETPAEELPEESEQVESAEMEENPIREEDLTEKAAGPTSMEIVFGSDVEEATPVCWYPNDTSRLFHTNMGIIGTMGTGKTQFAKSLITQLYRQQPNNYENGPLGILIFDYKGDYNETKWDFCQATRAKVLKPYHLPFNPMAMAKQKTFRPLLPSHTANAFKDTIAKSFRLGPKQQSALFKAIIKAYKNAGIRPETPSTWSLTPPTFKNVYQVYEDMDDITRGDSLAAAMEKLYNFEIFEPNPAKTVSLFSLLNGVVVIDLSGYDPDIQSLVVDVTLNLFYAQMHAAGSSRRSGNFREITKMILVDEADHFMSEGYPSLKKILKEGREFGVGTILSTQFLRHFNAGDDDYAKYILTWVVHNVADLRQSDVDFVFRTKAGSADGKAIFQHIRELREHQSIVKIGTEDPVTVQNLPFYRLVGEA